MVETASETTEETVERLITSLMKGIETFGEFDGAIGVGAVLTFTNRFMQTMVTLSPTRESKQENAHKIAHALRYMAGVIEFQVHEEAGQRVH